MEHTATLLHKANPLHLLQWNFEINHLRMKRDLPHWNTQAIPRS